MHPLAQIGAIRVYAVGLLAMLDGLAEEFFFRVATNHFDAVDTRLLAVDGTGHTYRLLSSRCAFVSQEMVHLHHRRIVQVHLVAFLAGN